MMQTNPKEAMQVYGKNPEFMLIFQEFCKLMGTHFSEIGKQEEPKKKTEVPASNVIQQDPEVDVQRKYIGNQIKNPNFLYRRFSRIQK